jgi:hypothetical protein
MVVPVEKRRRRICPAIRVSLARERPSKIARDARILTRPCRREADVSPPLGGLGPRGRALPFLGETAREAVDRPVDLFRIVTYATLPSDVDQIVLSVTQTGSFTNSFAVDRADDQIPMVNWSLIRRIPGSVREFSGSG